ncbi:hypothetical protein D8674_017721 [Pyrus ussuriensis x Pyrus communis]|uniref:Myb/SANT-like domain-containing protein n=1 Tax=Pyrus ussuriensis x Pyrus communis TaxID=2448454 RepID=A0A5N5HIN9_9ROSA|nr:hypothetical protein D8674_017721 [Pyrus ussuriensis x Pyrus communis]
MFICVTYVIYDFLIDYIATSSNWIDQEEDVLLTILEEMVVNGVRCETGSFKAGTFVMVASKMREQIPGINIESKHIQNKLKRLKEKYSSAYDMMNTFGFGWDDEKKCVVVDSDEILQEWVKKHPNASCKPNKPFPLYPRLCTVFGRDRAMGSMAELAEMQSKIWMPPPSPTPSPFVATSSASQPVRKRKRSRNDGDANIVSVISKGWNKAVTEMKKLGESFTFKEAKARLPSELQDTGLSYDQVLRILMKLVKDTDLMDIWSTLDDSRKPDFIKVFMESL